MENFFYTSKVLQLPTPSFFCFTLVFFIMVCILCWRNNNEGLPMIFWFWLWPYPACFNYALIICLQVLSYLSIVLFDWLVLWTGSKGISFQSYDSWRTLLRRGLVHFEKETPVVQGWRFGALLLLLSIYCCPASWQPWYCSRWPQVILSQHFQRVFSLNTEIYS